MTAESAEDLSWFKRAATGGFSEGNKGRRERRKERKKRRGEAEAVFNRSGVASRPAPRGTPTIIVLFDQSPPAISAMAGF